IADFSSCTEQPVCLPRDFGSSHAFYLSPEAIDDRPFSAIQSDSWAIGATLAPVISGLYPWSIAKKREDFFAIF
ncbi:hypothetical protein C8J56DRAFT_747408, partial [Mycena floridula]